MQRVSPRLPCGFWSARLRAESNGSGPLRLDTQKLLDDSNTQSTSAEDVRRFVGVNKWFGAVTALRDVDFHLGAAKIVGLIGDNGAGKTTLIRLAAGILTPSSGQVFTLGRRAMRADAWLMTRLGALIENPGHYEELSVEENLRFAYSFHCGAGSLGTVGEAVDTALTEFRLANVAGSVVGKLSSGYRQRLALARALHPWARVILLDEPFLSLDPDVRGEIKGMLRKRATTGLLVLFSSHTLVDIERLADEILFLIAGRLHRFASFCEIREHVGAGSDEDTDVVYAELKRRLTPSTTE